MMLNWLVDLMVISLVDCYRPVVRLLFVCCWSVVGLLSVCYRSVVGLLVCLDKLANYRQLTVL
jgi:hypothetical protein